MSARSDGYQVRRPYIRSWQRLMSCTRKRIRVMILDMASSPFRRDHRRVVLRRPAAGTARSSSGYPPPRAHTPFPAVGSSGGRRAGTPPRHPQRAEVDLADHQRLEAGHPPSGGDHRLVIGVRPPGPRGPTERLFERPAHPYTGAMLSAVPIPSPRHQRERIVLTGEVPDATDPPSGCAFHTRCPYAMDVCREIAPEPSPVEGGGRPLSPAELMDGDGHTTPTESVARRRLITAPVRIGATGGTDPHPDDDHTRTHSRRARSPVQRPAPARA